jgi:hypothetical protein
VDTVRLPFTGDVGNSVRNSLGAFWSIVYKDTSLLSAYFSGSGLVAAQVYLEFLEAEASIGRLTIPNYHRERWYPVVIRKSQRNTGKAVAIICGQQPPLVVGPQPEDTQYIPNISYDIGGAASRHGMVAYPIYDGTINAGVSSISDDVITPDRVLTRNMHFIIEKDSVLFVQSEDPFRPGTPYPRRVVLNEDGTTDEEILLWAADALQDREFMYDHFGYAVEFRDPTNQLYADRVNALWDLRYKASELSVLRKAIGDMLGAPVTTSQETVEAIVQDENGQKVVTDIAVYRIGPDEELRDEVIVGAVIESGEFLTNTVRLYHHLDTRNFEAANGIPLGTFIEDVPSIYLPAGVVGNYAAGVGFAVTYEDVPLTFEGNDSSGNPRLRFEVGADPAVANSYWIGVWNNAEARGESLADVFSEFLYAPPPYHVVGEQVGEINPMKFFMDNSLYANGAILVVDFGKLPPYITSLNVLSRLKTLIPAHILLLVVGRQDVADEFDLEEDSEESFEAYHAVALADTADPSQPVDDALIYKDCPVITRWIKQCN